MSTSSLSTATQRLFDAIEHNDPIELHKALDQKADVSAFQKRLTPLHKLVICYSELSDVAKYDPLLDILTKHISAQPNCERIFNAVDLLRHGTPLHLAVLKSRTYAIKLLLKVNPNPIWRTPRKRQTPLHLASKIGKIEVVRLLLKSPKLVECINAQDYHGCTALHKAATPEIVRELFNHGANLTVINKKKLNPLEKADKKGLRTVVDELETLKLDPTTFCLHYSNACLSGVDEDIKRAKKYIAQGRIDKSGIDESCVLITISGDGELIGTQIELINLLIRAGADINKSQNGITPLHLAANYSSEAVRLLLSYGANPNVVCNNGSTPLLRAVQEGNFDSACLLLEAGADPHFILSEENRTLKEKLPYKWLSLFVRMGANISIKHSIASMILLFTIPHRDAAQTNRDIVMRRLNTRNEHGWTPLFCAIQNYDLTEAKRLIEAGANLEIRCDGKTPLVHAACEAFFCPPDSGSADFYREIIELLLKAGVKTKDLFFHTNDHDGRLVLLSPLLFFLEKGSNSSDIQRSIFKMLLDHKADPNQWVGNQTQKWTDNSTLIHMAAKYQAYGLELLIRAGGDVSAVNKKGETPLFWARCQEVVDALINAGASLEVVNNEGCTPLIHALISDNEEGFKCILKALPSLQILQLQNALEIAEQKGNLDIIALIKAKIHPSQDSLFGGPFVLPEGYKKPAAMPFSQVPPLNKPAAASSSNPNVHGFSTLNMGSGTSQTNGPHVNHKPAASTLPPNVVSITQTVPEPVTPYGRTVSHRTLVSKVFVLEARANFTDARFERVESKLDDLKNAQEDCYQRVKKIEATNNASFEELRKELAKETMNRMKAEASMRTNLENYFLSGPGKDKIIQFFKNENASLRSELTILTALTNQVKQQSDATNKRYEKKQRIKDEIERIEKSCPSLVGFYHGLLDLFYAKIFSAICIYSKEIETTKGITGFAAKGLSALLQSAPLPFFGILGFAFEEGVIFLKDYNYKQKNKKIIATIKNPLEAKEFVSLVCLRIAQHFASIVPEFKAAAAVSFTEQEAMKKGCDVAKVVFKLMVTLDCDSGTPLTKEEIIQKLITALDTRIRNDESIFNKETLLAAPINQQGPAAKPAAANSSPPPVKRALVV